MLPVVPSHSSHVLRLAAMRRRGSGTTLARAFFSYAESAWGI